MFEFIKRRSGLRTSLGKRTPSRPLLFLHIPKTAGITIRLHLTQLYGGKKVWNIWGRKLTDMLKTGDPDDCNLIMGHFGFDEADALLERFFSICFLRNPRDRLISTYRYWASHRLEVVQEKGWWWMIKAKENDIESFFSDPAIRQLEDVNNTIVRYLTSRTYDQSSSTLDFETLTSQAIRNLSRFSFVGTQETFLADLHKLEKRLECTFSNKGKVLNTSKEAEARNPDLESIQFEEPSSQTFEDVIEDLICFDRKVYESLQQKSS